MERKQLTETLILNEARSVFMEKGIVGTVMRDIALRTDLSIRTLYRYFKSKEDIAYAIIIDILNEWNEFMTQSYQSLEGTGIEKIHQFLFKLLDAVEIFEDELRYISEFDFYFTESMEDVVSLERLQDYQNIILVSDILFKLMIDLGQEDGTITKDIDVDLFVVTMSQVLWSFAQRIVVRKNIIKEESGLDGLVLMHEQIMIYINHLKGV